MLEKEYKNILKQYQLRGNETIKSTINSWNHFIKKHPNAKIKFEQFIVRYGYVSYKK